MDVRALLLLVNLLLAYALPGASPRADSVHRAVDAVIPQLMAKDRIPGMAVGVTVDGNEYVVNYGSASDTPRTPVTDATLFELGSVTKAFTATLVSWARVRGQLSLDARTDQYLPQLRGTPFGRVTLRDLGTHTVGGLPLQVPDDVTSDAELMRYLERWRPSYPIGLVRTYNNPGIGILGMIAARRMHAPFRALMEERLFPALGLRHAYIAIPRDERSVYAMGHTDGGRHIRLHAGMLADETYGIRITAADMIHFIHENVDPSALQPSLRAAMVATRTGYDRIGAMTQDLIWEQYAYPPSLGSLLDGNGLRMIFDPMRVTPIDPPSPPEPRAWVNKTGSTNGFATYVAFVPSQRIGIVLLANKSYPIADRVRAAYRILERLAGAR
jgi:beta-lactamase class C